MAEDIAIQESSTLYEVVTSSEFAFWVVAMNEEIESLCKNQPWDLEKSLEDMKIDGLRRLLYGLEQSPGQRYKRCVLWAIFMWFFCLFVALCG